MLKKGSPTYKISLMCTSVDPLMPTNVEVLISISKLNSERNFVHWYIFNIFNIFNMLYILINLMYLIYLISLSIFNDHCFKNRNIELLKTTFKLSSNFHVKFDVL